MFECLAGDLLNPDFCKGPFDVVIERRMVQLFSEKERAEVLENLTARLNPGGIFVSHCHMGWWRPGMSREHLFASWFREHGFEIGGWRSRDNVQASRDSMPIAFLSVSTG